MYFTSMRCTAGMNVVNNHNLSAMNVFTEAYYEQQLLNLIRPHLSICMPVQ